MVAFLHSRCLPCARQLEVLDFARDRQAGRVNFVAVFLDDAAGHADPGVPRRRRRDPGLRPARPGAAAREDGTASTPCRRCSSSTRGAGSSSRAAATARRSGTSSTATSMSAFAAGARRGRGRRPGRPGGPPPARGGLRVPARGQAGVRPALPGADPRDAARLPLGPPAHRRSRPRRRPSGTWRSAAWRATSPREPQTYDSPGPPDDRRAARPGTLTGPATATRRRGAPGAAARRA